MSDRQSLHLAFFSTQISGNLFNKKSFHAIFEVQMFTPNIIPGKHTEEHQNDCENC